MSLFLVLACAIPGATAGCSDSAGDDSDTPGDVPADDGVGPDADADGDDVDAGPDAADDGAVPDGPADDGPPVPVTFTRHTIDGARPGPGFAAAADVDGDGALELVSTAFGSMGMTVPNGDVRIYERGADWDDWPSTEVVGTDARVRFPNHPNVVDVDGDGDLDIILPSGFLACEAAMAGACGALGWYEQTGGDWVRHDVVPVGNRLFYHHAEWVDFDGDGVRDLVTVGERKPTFGASEASAQWFKGTTDGDRFERDPRGIGPGLGSLPTVRDLDGDGDLDVASAEFFVGDGSFAWYERLEEPSTANPAEVWQHHLVNADSGPAIQLSFVENLYGDGVLRAVGSNHTNTATRPPDPWESAVFVFDLSGDPRDPWTRTQISTGIVSVAGSMLAPQAAPGIFDVGDIDGDGDLDLLLSGDGDPHVFWLEQHADRSWETHVLAEGLSQAGSIVIADFDGDGRNELVASGYDANVIHVWVRD
ncbi:MAG: VCBS repeat-containing protein [Deltaproteobacteria bacterium]|nr:VCBS repeat-containing protein [Deltaproteobacteria bacterium]